MGGEMRRAKSLRIGVHHANAVVWGTVCRTHLTTSPPPVALPIAQTASAAASLTGASLSSSAATHCGSVVFASRPFMSWPSLAMSSNALSIVRSSPSRTRQFLCFHALDRPPTSVAGSLRLSGWS